MENQSKQENSAGKTNCVGLLAPRTESAKKYWNRFCWLCHKEGSNDKKKCGSCYHIYHTECLRNETICPDCKIANIRSKEFDSVDREMLKRLLDKLLSDEVFVGTQMIQKSLVLIESKLAEYSNFGTFLDDIKWTTHKCILGYIKGEEKLVPIAERLHVYCVNQVNSIQACVECHKNSWEHTDRYATMVCQAAHPVLWAWMECDSSYWPAKCMRVVDSKVFVCIFGYDIQKDIDVKDCFMYSRNRPNRGEQKPITDNFTAAVKVANAYIENWSKEHGNYKLAAIYTPFNANFHLRNETGSTVFSKMSLSKSVPSKISTLPKLTVLKPISPDPSRPKMMSTAPLIRVRPAEQLQQNYRSMPTNNSFTMNDEQNEKPTTNGNSTYNKPFRPNSLPKKRKFTDVSAPSSSLPNADKSTPPPPSAAQNEQINYLKMNFKEYLEKSKRLCTGLGHLENKVGELQLANKRLVYDAKQHQLDYDKLMGENQMLRKQIEQTKINWAQKLQAAEKQQWCIVCRRQPDIPFLCTNNCRMIYWKSQIHKHD
ncbi:protein kinase C-binding protein 1-like [Contarinia nasturtii]|uniref:protein kinase C-binding protein 1-like n=1 Tax=Contarinia nasturtii TaxID=265458 RepID=UPI0012D3BDE7|nr:protein kinase C-binding protein 1-like [Contarinia nasturtii]